MHDTSLRNAKRALAETGLILIGNGYFSISCFSQSYGNRATQLEEWLQERRFLGLLSGLK